jgi:23S rRNA pseudouridine955/2504/2580 synthase
MRQATFRKTFAMPAVETRTVAPDEAGMRLDRWFRAHFPALGFTHLQKLIRSGQVRIDGGRAKTNTRLAPGQSVRIPPLEARETGSANLRPRIKSGAGSSRPASRAPQDEEGRKLHSGRGGGHRIPHPEVRGRSPSLEGRAASGPKSPNSDADYLRSLILYEDDDVFVFNKPAGLASQGGSGLSRHMDGLLESLRDRKDQKPRLVHRLDRDTSGVLVVAKTRLAAQKLAAAFRTRSTRKIYWALVKGVPKPRQGRVSTWLARGAGAEGEKMLVARHGEDEASHAVSLYSVVENAGQKLAWLSMRPVTGRTHQLRAHAAHIGHPIIGDPKYFSADHNWDFPGGMQKKLHLHARRIVMPHPKGGVIDVTAPLPPHMQQSWNLLGFDADAYHGNEGDED